jgi:hypothetical protein
LLKGVMFAIFATYKYLDNNLGPFWVFSNSML